MSYTSTVAVVVNVSGNGVTSTNAPVNQTNATAPAGGPVEVTVPAGGTGTSLTPPVGTTGLVICPGTCTGTLKLGGIYDTGSGANISARSEFPIAFGFDPAAMTTLNIYNLLGGTVFVQWT